MHSIMGTQLHPLPYELCKYVPAVYLSFSQWFHLRYYKKDYDGLLVHCFEQSYLGQYLSNLPALAYGSCKVSEQATIQCYVYRSKRFFRCIDGQGFWII